MPFNAPFPSLAELDAALEALENAVQTFESSDWIIPGVGSELQTIKWELAPTVYVNGTTIEDGAVSLTTGVSASIATVSLPPGKYEVSPFAIFKQLTGTPNVENISLGCNETAGVMSPTGSTATSFVRGTLSIPAAIAGAVRYYDFSAEETNTSLYMIARANWTAGGTVGAFGTIRCRKIP